MHPDDAQIKMYLINLCTFENSSSFGIIVDLAEFNLYI